MEKFKALSILALLVMSVLAISVPANAGTVPVEITDVEVNGHSVFGTTEDSARRIEIDNKLDIDVSLEATGAEDYVVVEASLRGLDHDAAKAQDTTSTFSLSSGDKYIATLTIETPTRMDAGVYDLRIEVYNKKDTLVRKDVYLNVNPSRNRVDIKDVIFSPANEVKAGYTLISNVRVKNYGLFDENDVKVTVSVPELGAAATDSAYISDLEADDTKTTEDLWFRVPADAKNGEYKVIVKVEYDDGDKSVESEYKINVVGGKDIEQTATSGKTIIAVSSEAQNIAAGGDAVTYPITLSNAGDVSKTYTITANVGDWGTVQVAPSMLVLKAGETKVVYVSVAANEDATAGKQVFGVTVSTGDKSEEITMNANVTEAKSSGSLKNGLEITLVVLVAILIIVALIVGFTRLRKNDEEVSGEQTYY